MASEAWKYFKIDPNNDQYARCTICDKLVSRGGSSKTTSNLWKHLQTHKKRGQKLDDKPLNRPKPRSQPVLNISGPSDLITSGATGTLDAFFKPQAENIPTLPGNVSTVEIDSEECDDPADLSCLSVDIGENLDLYRPTTSGSQQSVSTLSPISKTSATSPDLSLISPNSETQKSPASYPKLIKLKDRTKQITLEGIIDRVSKFSTNDDRAKKINNLIAEMICIDLQPFSIVENKGFLRLLSHLEPRYTVPSRKTFSNKILNEMYSKLSREVKSELEESKYVAITTDMWTSVAQNDYMAVTAHFYKEETNALTLTHRCLDVVPFPEISHTGDNILDFLRSVFKEWGIIEKVIGVVRDNGADITAALNRSNFEAFPCVAHTLQLVIKDGFIDNAKISNLIKKSRKLVGSFKHSAKNTKMLKAVQLQLGIPAHRMVQDEPTRWNSTYYMLKRLLEQKDAIVILSTKADININLIEMTAEDWKTMKFAVDLLEIFETATIQLSKETTTISEVSLLINFVSVFVVVEFVLP